MIILKSFFGTLIVPNPSHAYNMAYTFLVPPSFISGYLSYLCYLCLVDVNWPGGHGARANWRRLRTKVAMVAGCYSRGFCQALWSLLITIAILGGMGSKSKGVMDISAMRLVPGG